MKNIIKIIRRIIIATFTIFTFNIMISPLNVVIPINYYTIGFTFIFGLLSLPFFAILIKYFI